VAWTSGRSTGLATALVVAGLVVHATPALHGQRRWRAAIAAGLFALACMAKETAIIFPILVLLWDWTRGEAEEPGVLRAGPAFAVALASAAVMALSSRYRDLLDHSLGQRGLLESLTVNVRALPRLLSLWLRPSELSIVQPFDPGAGDPAGVTLGIACAAVLVAGVALRRRAPMVALATGWVLVALLPTCSVIVRTEVVSAKALYPAWIGPALVLGAGVSALSTRIRMRRAPAAAMATVIAGVMWVASVAVVDEVRVWSDDVALWERAVRRAPGDAIAWNNLGAGLLAARRPAAAIDAFRVALTLEPRNARTRMNLSLAAVLCGPTCERRP
jgi:hypothetical protein